MSSVSVPLFAQKIIDELLRRPARKPSVGQLPAVRLQKQLLLFHFQPGPVRQGFHDPAKLPLIRRSEIDGHAETGYKRQLFLHRIVGMQLLIPLLLIPEALPDQMPAVGGGIDEDVIRLLLQPSLDDGF